MWNIPLTMLEWRNMHKQQWKISMCLFKWLQWEKLFSTYVDPMQCPFGYVHYILVGIEPFSKLVKPFLTSTPTSKVIVELGNSTNLTCEAAGYPIPTFQWYKDGVPISGENEPSLFISEVLPGDRGKYSCKATNSQGAVESGQTQLLLPRMILTVFVW